MGLSDGLKFNIVPLKEMFGHNNNVWCKGPPNQATTTNQPRNIFLPLKEEALFLFELYVQYVSYLHHVIHVPTTRAMVHEVYSDLNCNQVRRTPGSLDVSYRRPPCKHLRPVLGRSARRYCSVLQVAFSSLRSMFLTEAPLLFASAHTPTPAHTLASASDTI